MSINTTLSVLVVEPKPSDRKVAEAILERQGYAVASCATGVEALRLLIEERRHFDAVIVSAREVNTVIRIRAQHRMNNVSVICATSDTSFLTDIEGREKACDVMVRKPYRQELLTQALVDVWQQRGVLPA